MLEETLKIASSPLEEQPGCFLLTLEGELDSSNAQDVIKYVLNMIENDGLKNLIADFAKLRYINSTGLGAILRISKTLSAKNGNFMIVGPNENVFEIIEIVGANKLLYIYQTKEEALNSLKS
jgi:anti-anti-sigma factor|uniref:Anti-sigma factor antagonist n=1 Tax=uncultured bacterium contig00092 TaxID=1181563 RepID=A0A806KLB1_9BACT|nr:anti-sigma-factor antagonist [uncultured bacterium contig00092]